MKFSSSQPCLICMTLKKQYFYTHTLTFTIIFSIVICYERVILTLYICAVIQLYAGHTVLCTSVYSSGICTLVSQASPYDTTFLVGVLGCTEGPPIPQHCPTGDSSRIDIRSLLDIIWSSEPLTADIVLDKTTENSYVPIASFQVYISYFWDNKQARKEYCLPWAHWFDRHSCAWYYAFNILLVTFQAQTEAWKTLQVCFG